MKELEFKLDMAAKLARKGRVSRRDFVQLAMAAGFTAAAADTMFTTAARAEPKKGGHFRMGMGHGATTDSLDPATYPDQMTGTVGWGSMGNSLTEVDAKGRIIPDLAESFEPGDDAKTWVFKLRKGATFHNGKTVTPADVIASFRHHMGKDSKSAAKSYVDAIADIKADGDKVVFKLSGGNADFPYIASDYHIPIMPAKDDGTVDWQSGIRTGPYVLDKWEPGVRATMKRNPNYYRDTWFDEVTATVIADVAARTNALNSGEIDYMDRCDLKTLKMLERNAALNINKILGYGHYIFVMDVRRPPFDNPDVRNALKFAVDRADIAAKVFSGINKPANDNPIAPTIPYAIDPQPIHKYDPEMAKSLLKKAGLRPAQDRPVGLRCRLHRCRRCRDLVQGSCRGRQYRHQHHSRVGRQLLGRRLAEEAVRRLLLERPAGSGPDVLRRLCQGRGLERHLLGQSALQRAPSPGPLRDRRRQAQGDVCRDAAAGA